MEKIYKGNFIDGVWQKGSGSVFTSTDPSCADIIWQGAEADSAEVDEAFTAAKKAFASWSQTDFATREKIVKKFKQIAIENKNKLAELIARETGKVLWDANGEAGAVAGKVDISLKSYIDRTGSSSTKTAFGSAVLVHKPHGVMAVLGPYNFPAHLPNGQIIPALIAGNTIVFKPSEQCPAVGEFLVSLYEQAGFPKGVINMVQGGRDTGAAVLDNDKLNGVLFTGSATTGVFIHKKFAGRPEIILALEMGGNNPLLLWDVESAEAAASIIINSAFITTGQRCTCARRILLPAGKQGDEILGAVIAMTKSIRIGAWNDTDTAFMGPLINAQMADFVNQKAAELEKLGAKTLLVGGKMARGEAFIRPHIMDTSGLDVTDEEIFGPVMQIHRIKSFEDGIELANNTRFGLAAGLVSDNKNNWDIFARKIKAGVVNFNRPTTGAAGFLPFGGPGLSGNHNPGAYYAADFCAWPMASQISETVEMQAVQGLSTC